MCRNMDGWKIYSVHLNQSWAEFDTESWYGIFLANWSLVYWRASSWERIRGMAIEMSACVFLSAKINKNERGLCSLEVKGAGANWGAQGVYKMQFYYLFALLTFPGCLLPALFAPVDSPFLDVLQSIFLFGICFSIPWQNHEHLLLK